PRQRRHYHVGPVARQVIDGGTQRPHPAVQLLSPSPKSWRGGGLKRVPEFPLRNDPVRIQRPARSVSEGPPASPPFLFPPCLPGDPGRHPAWPRASFVLPG